jgi:DeoR family transcriptional regulator, glycerol-3-phosphate regulon repressor
MEIEQRHAEILELAKAQGKVLVDHLASHFRVTAQTIREEVGHLSVSTGTGSISV